jgi:hypothetical protein
LDREPRLNFTPIRIFISGHDGLNRKIPLNPPFSKGEAMRSLHF